MSCWRKIFKLFLTSAKKKKMFSFRYHGTGVCEVWFTGHLLKEEQELDKHPVEAGGG